MKYENCYELQIVYKAPKSIISQIVLHKTWDLLLNLSKDLETTCQIGCLYKFGKTIFSPKPTNRIFTTFKKATS